MTKGLQGYFLAVVFATVLGFPQASHGQTSGLVGLLTSQLGVSEQQASGGAGSLLDFAKGQMSAADFDVVTQALPDVGTLVGSAPSGGSSMLGSSSSLLSGASGGLEGAAGVAGAFSELGMSPEMVNQFVPVILDYAKSAGNEQVMQLLQGAFSAL